MNTTEYPNMLEEEVTQALLSQFDSLFPQLRLVSADISPERPGERKPDLTMTVETATGQTLILLCEIRSTGTPSRLRDAALQTRSIADEERQGYPVVIAPYISSRGREVLLNEGVGYLDLSGNSYLAVGDVHLEVSGKPNRYKAERRMKGLFMGKSERLVRVLLVQPERRWVLRALSAEADVSLGYVSEIVNRLAEERLVEKLKGGGIRPLDPGILLEQWRDIYSVRRNDQLLFYTLLTPDSFRTELAQYCKAKRRDLALTLFAGSDYVAPFTSHSRTDAYVTGNLRELAASLQLKEVTSGANVVLLRPYDAGLLYGIQQRNGFPIVSNVQLYLDLYTSGGRGPDQAEFLRSEVIGY